MEEKVVKAKNTPEQKVDVQAFVSRKLNALNQVGGAKAKSNISYEYSKRMCLPSGLVKIFLMNKVEEVSYEDGVFLKGFKYVYGGKVYYPFIEV